MYLEVCVVNIKRDGIVVHFHPLILPKQRVREAHGILASTLTLSDISREVLKPSSYHPFPCQIFIIYTLCPCPGRSKKDLALYHRIAILIILQDVGHARTTTNFVAYPKDYTNTLSKEWICLLDK